VADAVSTGRPSNIATVSLKVVPPPPAPPARPRTVTSPVTYNWYLKSRRGRIMRIQSLVVRSLPLGATVTLRCSGKRCPFTKRTIKRSRKSTMNVLKAKTLRHKVTFRAGQTVDVRIAAPGMNTKVLRFKLRKGKVPKHQSYCIALGSTKLQRSC